MRLLTALLCAVLLSACAQPARVSQMTVSNIAGGSVAADPSLLGLLGVDQVTGGQETNPLWTSEVGNPEFRAALENSLQANGLLAKDAAAAPYRLTATLDKVDQPVFAGNTTVTSVVTYRVTAADGAPFFEQSITKSFTASMSESLYGVARLRLANEGSIAANITAFIEAFIAHWRDHKPTA